MDPIHEIARGKFQDEIDSVSSGDTLQLFPREFPGPVEIKNSILIDGQGATIWALKGPVLSILEDGVTLKNLRIEMTGETESGDIEDKCAVLCKKGINKITLEDVEVRGSVIGLPEEEGEWRYPHFLNIGQLPYNKKLDLLIRIVVPVPCRITSNITGLKVEPSNLKAGNHELHLFIDSLQKDTLIDGIICMSTAFIKRRFNVSAYFSASSSGELKDKVIWQPADWSTLASIEQQKPQLSKKSAKANLKDDGDRKETKRKTTQLPMQKEEMPSPVRNPLIPAPPVKKTEMAKIDVGMGYKNPQVFKDIFEQNKGLLKHPVKIVEEKKLADFVYYIQEYAGVHSDCRYFVCFEPGNKEAFCVKHGIGKFYGENQDDLGTPLGEENSVVSSSGTKATVQEFRMGNKPWNKRRVYFHLDGKYGYQTFYLRGSINTKYEEMGAEKSTLGLPTSNEKKLAGSIVTDFESGYIEWDKKTNEVKVYELRKIRKHKKDKHIPLKPVESPTKVASPTIIEAPHYTSSTPKKSIFTDETVDPRLYEKSSKSKPVVSGLFTNHEKEKPEEVPLTHQEVKKQILKPLESSISMKSPLPKKSIPSIVEKNETKTTATFITPHPNRTTSSRVPGAAFGQQTLPASSKTKNQKTEDNIKQKQPKPTSFAQHKKQETEEQTNGEIPRNNSGKSKRKVINPGNIPSIFGESVK